MGSSQGDNGKLSLIGQYFDGGEAQGVHAQGDYLYVADNYFIEVFNIADPANLQKIGEYKVSGAHDIFVDDDIIFTAAGMRKLIIFQANLIP